MIVSPRELQDALRGLPYPATKQQLLARASTNDAEHSVKRALNSVPDRTYTGFHEVSTAVAGVR